MKMGAPIIFSKFENIIHELIRVKNIFYQGTIKIDNGSVAMIFLFDTNGSNNSINFLKVRLSRIEDYLNCATTFFI